MRILICGNIVWDDAKPIFDTMHAYAKAYDPHKLTYVSGMAPGADYIAYVLTHVFANAYCDEYPFNDEGRRKIKKIMGEDYAESYRNQWMLDSGVDVCHAYAEDLPGKWSGTRDMVNRCLEHGGIPCFWHNGTSVYEIVSDERWSQDKRDSMVIVETTLADAIDAVAV